MTERLPPLLWVRAFEVAARHENFVSAASELSVSPGAVSRAVKELEAFLGVTLFVRKPRGVELTDVARAYALILSPALQQIARACLEVSQSHANPRLFDSSRGAGDAGLGIRSLDS